MQFVWEKVVAGPPSIAHRERIMGALAVIGWFGMLRPGETILDGKTGHAVKIGGLTPMVDGKVIPHDQFESMNSFILKLDSSKGDRASHGWSTTLFMSGASVCPVGAVKILFRGAKKMNLGPLDWVAQAAGGKTPSPHEFRESLRKWATVSGAATQGDPTVVFSTHGLRYGGACAGLANNALSVEGLKSRGRWKSNAIQIYIERALGEGSDWASKLVQKDALLKPSSSSRAQ